MCPICALKWVTNKNWVTEEPYLNRPYLSPIYLPALCPLVYLPLTPYLTYLLHANHSKKIFLGSDQMDKLTRVKPS